MESTVYTSNNTIGDINQFINDNDSIMLWKDYDSTVFCGGHRSIAELLSLIRSPRIREDCTATFYIVQKGHPFQLKLPLTYSIFYIIIVINQILLIHSKKGQAKI